MENDLFDTNSHNDQQVAITDEHQWQIYCENERKRPNPNIMKKSWILK
jgi:hypothetical protein